MLMRVWTLDKVLAPPEDVGQRVELFDGTIAVHPAPRLRHQRILHQLQVGLAAALPPGLELLPRVNVATSPSRLVVPDIVVLSRSTSTVSTSRQPTCCWCWRSSRPTPTPRPGAQAAALHRSGNRALRPGGPLTEPTTADILRLDGDQYTTIVEKAPHVLKLDEPFPVEVGLDQ